MGLFMAEKTVNVSLPWISNNLGFNHQIFGNRDCYKLFVTISENLGSENIVS